MDVNVHALPSTGSSSVTTIPYDFTKADQDLLAILIADLLSRVITHNDKIPLQPASLTRFHSRTPPAISILDYLRRIVQYTNVEHSCLLITLHYIDQICARNPQFTITSLTVHRFIIASVTVSSKALCDTFCTNAHYAKVGGIRLAEINVLEREFLSFIDWRLTCTRELLQAYYVKLARTHSTGQYQLASPSTSNNSSSSEPESSASDTSPESRPAPLPPIAGPATLLRPVTAPVATEDSSPESSPVIPRPTVAQSQAFAALRSGTGSASAAAGVAATSPNGQRAKRNSAHVELISVDAFRPRGRRRLDGES